MRGSRGMTPQGPIDVLTVQGTMSKKQIPHPAKNAGFGMTILFGRKSNEDVNRATSAISQFSPPLVPLNHHFRNSSLTSPQIGLLCPQEVYPNSGLRPFEKSIAQGDPVSCFLRGANGCPCARNLSCMGQSATEEATASSPKENQKS